MEKRGKNSPKNIQLKSCAGKNRLKFIFSYRLIVQQRQKGKELEWADEYGGFFGGPSRIERPGDSQSGVPSSLCGIGTQGKFVGCRRFIRTKEIYSSDKMSATKLLSLEGVFPDYRYLSDLRSTNPTMPPALRAISGTVKKTPLLFSPHLHRPYAAKKRRCVIIANLLRCYRIWAWSCTSVHSLRPHPLAPCILAILTHLPMGLMQYII